MNPAIQAVLTIVFGVGGCIAYFFLSNLFLDKVVFPLSGPNIGRNITRGNMVRPWLFLFPALALLGLYLAYPVFATAWLSLTQDAPGNTREFVGLANYSQMFTESKFWESMKNNMIWLLVVPAMSTAFGVLAAQLTDRIWWGNIAKSLIFMPMAISFVGASVIWKLIYDTRPIDQAQIGLLNALWLKLGGGFWSVVVVKVLPAITIGALATYYRRNEPAAFVLALLALAACLVQAESGIIFSIFVKQYHNYAAFFALFLSLLVVQVLANLVVAALPARQTGASGQ